jgi:hypothetical protein
MSFETYLPSIAPPWLAGPSGGPYWGKVGKLFDDVSLRMKDAVKARFPSNAATDGLDQVGRDRYLPRGPGEGNIPYALRLLGAWTTWAGDNTPLTGVGGGAGAHLAMLSALRVLGLPIGATGMTIVQQNGRYAQLSGGGALVVGSLMNCVNRIDLSGVINARPGWTFEGRDNFFSEFGIVFPVDVPSLTLGSSLATQVNDGARKWKPGKAVFVGTWVIQTGITLGWPTGRTLGTDPNLGGNVIRYLPPAEGNGIGYYP